jgi:hypothetical protein
MNGRSRQPWPKEHENGSERYARSQRNDNGNHPQVLGSLIHDRILACPVKAQEVNKTAIPVGEPKVDPRKPPELLLVFELRRGRSR